MFTLIDEPLWRVLYVYQQLEERDERQALRRRRERVDAGLMTAFAFNQPEKLADELDRVRDAIDEFEYGPQATDIEAMRARGRALADRMLATNALSDEALVS